MLDCNQKLKHVRCLVQPRVGVALDAEFGAQHLRAGERAGGRATRHPPGA
jgi:hypothetical protein